jgi:hypothetical protein
MQQNEEKSFLQGLKPVESAPFMSALKHRPPGEAKAAPPLKKETFSTACEVVA